MELSPLGGGPAPTPGTTQAQTPPTAPPVHEIPNRPSNTGWENPYAQPVPSVETVTTQRSNGSTIATRAIVSVLAFLVLGGLRVYSRYQRMQERYEPTSEQAVNQDNPPRSFRDDTAPATPEPPALLPNRAYNSQGHPAPLFTPYPNQGLSQPQGMQNPSLPPQAKDLLRRELKKVANGRGITLVTIRPLGSGIYQALVSYSNAEESRLTFDGTTWTTAAGNATLSQSPPPSGGGISVSSAPPTGPTPYVNAPTQQTTAAPGTSTAPGNMNPVPSSPSEPANNSTPPGNTTNTTPPPLPPTGG